MAETETATLPVLDALTLSDRCDRCGAQAFYAVLFSAANTPLMFCGHHANEHEAAILAAGPVDVLDQRDQINAKPSPSAY